MIIIVFLLLHNILLLLFWWRRQVFFFWITKRTMDNTIRTSMKVTLGHLRDVRRGLPCTAHIETLLQGTTASTERPSTLLLTLLYTRATLLKHALCRTTFWSAVHFLYRVWNSPREKRRTETTVGIPRIKWAPSTYRLSARMAACHSFYLLFRHWRCPPYFYILVAWRGSCLSP